MRMRALLYYRSKLDEHDQAVYDSLVDQWMHFTRDIRIPVPHCDFSQLTEAIHFDYPLLFYVNYYRLAYYKSIFGIGLQGDYLYTRKDAEVLLKKCEDWGKYIYNHIPANLGTVEKALWLHDVILNNVTYNEDDIIRSHNMIGVVSDKKAVCEGIAMAYKFLCDYADIPCITVSGTLNGEPHGWNMVWINNATSFIDVTNDLSSVPGKFGRSCFLRKSSEMAGYTWDTSLIPECRLTNKSNAFLKARSGEELLQITAQSGSSDSLGIHLDFGHFLTQQDIQMLIALCCLNCPVLQTKSLSYSVEGQMIYIQNR